MSNPYSYHNTFYKTFTGTDTLAFIMLPNSKPILLGSLTTISYSIFREKRPVPILGKINTGGYTRGMRTIAGTLIFTVINHHFVEDLVEQIPYLYLHDKIKADELPFFDMLIICANEYGSSAQMTIYGAEFLDDASVMSINDMFIENTFGFVARDIDILSSRTQNGKESSTAPSIAPGEEDNEKVLKTAPYSLNTLNIIDPFKESSSDILAIQKNLNEKGYPTNISGVYDNTTIDSIIKFQMDNDINSTGILNNITKQLILSEEKINNVTRVSNKNGAYIYSSPLRENVVGIAKYNDNVIGDIIGDMYKTSCLNNDGYLSLNDLYINKPKYTLSASNKEDNVLHKVKFEDFNATDFGGEFIFDQDTTVNISAISYYNDIDNTSSYKLTRTCKKGKTYEFSLIAFKDSYIYNIEKNKMPKQIEFIVSPSSMKPIKWLVELI